MKTPQMLTQSRAGPVAKSVLLFSGGLDSLCYNHLLRPDVCLYIPSGAMYEAHERACVERLKQKIHLPIKILHDALFLGDFERDDLIVPNRNAHLVLLASHFGDTIYLSSVDGDRSLDKDDLFYQQMQALLDHMWDEQHWTARRQFSVSAPYKAITKTKLVEMHLKAEGDREALLISYSCYAGEPSHCGVCKPCARKRVALANNGVEVPAGYFKEDFWRAPWFETLRPDILAGTYRGMEDADFYRFLRSEGVI